MKASSLVSLLCALCVSLQSAICIATPPTKDECIQADTDGQSLRMTAKLRAAREKFSLCASSSCPGMVRDDCAQRLDEVQRVTPTIVFDVRDADGTALANVEVVMDGLTLVDHLTGTALPVDPGMHTFVFDMAGRASVHESLLIHESEKDVRLRINAGALPAPAPAQPLPVASAAPPEQRPSAAAVPDNAAGANQRRLGLIVGGAGAAAAVVGSVAGILSFTSYNSQKSNCLASTVQDCTNHSQAVIDHGSAVTAATVSTIAFVLGGVGVAGGAFLFFSAPRGDAGPSVGIAPSFGSGSGGVTVSGAF